MCVLSVEDFFNAMSGFGEHEFNHRKEILKFIKYPILAEKFTNHKSLKLFHKQMDLFNGLVF